MPTFTKDDRLWIARRGDRNVPPYKRRWATLDAFYREAGGGKAWRAEMERWLDLADSRQAAWRRVKDLECSDHRVGCARGAYMLAVLLAEEHLSSARFFRGADAGDVAHLAWAACLVMDGPAERFFRGADAGYTACDGPMQSRRGFLTRVNRTVGWWLNAGGPPLG